MTDRKMPRYTIKPLVFKPWVHQIGAEAQGKIHATTFFGDYFVWQDRGHWRWSHPLSGPHRYEKAKSIDHAVNCCNAAHRGFLERELEWVHLCRECLFFVREEWDEGWCTHEASIRESNDEACKHLVEIKSTN